MAIGSRHIFKHIKTASFKSVAMPGVQSIEVSETVEHQSLRAQNVTYPDDRMGSIVEQSITVEIQDLNLWSNANFAPMSSGTLTWKIEKLSTDAVESTFTVSNAMLVGRTTTGATGQPGSMTLTFATHATDGSTNPIVLA